MGSPWQKALAWRTLISYLSHREPLGRMNAWSLILIAETAPAGSEFPWGTFWTAAGVLVALIALGNQAGWFPPKYHMADANPLNDKLTLKIFGPPEIAARSPRLAQVVPRHEWPKYRDDGFKIVRVAFSREFFIGRECVFVAPKEDGALEERVLVARADGPPIPLSFHEELDEFSRTLSEMVRTFNSDAWEVQAAQGHYREKLRSLRLRYDVLHEEYLKRRAAGGGFHTVITQLTNADATLKDLNKRLDEMK